ncbi:hypothetical protein M409DRAFT_24860 [Zasmidium cellare ATCC 36951]|uniref:Uncharacterized protein n=1 Tax=Zasmidium cellare ATCC 36951 TaxID=1080233 RepID=A0A6A6CH05_ZASCE|nr:uncharacterized protein M409DRAFT_24860 [Zasmidium cellare ATCC 36951]KAF2164959.1 hypothetical protein M409DRAFT_24860 [Zasmidium cellare ATCC 36951]
MDPPTTPKTPVTSKYIPIITILAVVVFITLIVDLIRDRKFSREHEERMAKLRKSEETLDRLSREVERYCQWNALQREMEMEKEMWREREMALEQARREMGWWLFWVGGGGV